MRAEVIGSNGAYEVDDQGNVYSMPRLIRANYGDYICKEMKLKPIRLKDGYMVVTMRLGGKQRSAKVHRLVLAAFIGDKPELHCCHGNGDRSDNRLENLRWGTPQDNADDRTAHGTVVKGQNSPNSKLTDRQVLEIRQRSMPIAKQAAHYGVSVSLIRKIRSRQAWLHL